jgi:hypothetical protein
MPGIKQVADTRFDLDIALAELARAHHEVRRLEAGDISGHRLEDALSEPMARLDLARRLLVQVLARHRWEPYKASAGAEGPSRPIDGGRKRRSVPSPHRGRPRGRTARKDPSRPGP